ncbi:hypothetical protein C1646_690920 [Rhizophagus diaphanus]|nr:hypothetical protein C1646_690920 [Rhizophagus diaphanus] [Rhizophagus sp. MUCL 43196]
MYHILPFGHMTFLSHRIVKTNTERMNTHDHMIMVIFALNLSFGKPKVNHEMNKNNVEETNYYRLAV